MSHVTRSAAAGFMAVCIAGCAAQRGLANGNTAPPTHIDIEPVIVTVDEAATASEIEKRAERALIEQRWKDAADAYRLLLAVDPQGEKAAAYMFDLGLSLEGLAERVQARDVFMDLANRFPDGPKARTALLRAAALDATIEDWTALANIGETLLARADIEALDRIVALGSRGLARVELGELNGPSEAGSDLRASEDIHEGLDLADRFHYGDRDVLPVAIAQLRFALGELRRIRSERITFDPLPPDFLDKLDERCAGLLEAQAAYAQAVRSIDPHWAAMAGYRVGAMYRALHRDLMRIPPPATSKTEHQKQIFYAFMHIRYRVLLEKGLREIDQTVALGERTRDASTWIARARDAKAEMETALADEKAQIDRMPFTEQEVSKALELLAKKGTAPVASTRSTSRP